MFSTSLSHVLKGCGSSQELDVAKERLKEAKRALESVAEMMERIEIVTNNLGTAMKIGSAIAQVKLF